VRGSPVISFGPNDAWLIVGCNLPGCSNLPQLDANGQWGIWSPSSEDLYQFTQLHMDSPTSGWATGYHDLSPGGTQPPYQVAVLFRFRPIYNRQQDYSLPGWVGNSETGGYELAILLLGSSDDGWGFGQSLVPGESGLGAQFAISAAYHYHGGQFQKVAWPFKTIADITQLVRVSDSEYWAVGQILNGSSVLLHEVNGDWSEE
jgi:hypothetical protein